MEALDALGAGFDKALLALLDMDRFKAIHASLGDAGADAILLQVARAAGRRFGERGADFPRRRRRLCAFCFADPRRAPQAIGDALVEVCDPPYHAVKAAEVFAPCSVGLAAGAQSEDPLALIKNAELALIAAKRQGGACARVYSAELEAAGARRQRGAGKRICATPWRPARSMSIYQPIIRLADRSVAGFEALLRWQHPVQGPDLAGRFHRPFRGDRADRGAGPLRAGAGGHRSGPLAALFPADAAFVRQRQFFPPPVAAMPASRRCCKTVLAGSGIARKARLHLEITESAVAADRQDGARCMARIRAAGRRAVDRRFRHRRHHPERVPQPAVRHGQDRQELSGPPWPAPIIDTDGEVVLSGIIAMAHELKRAVVAEGRGKRGRRPACWPGWAANSARAIIFRRRSTPSGGTGLHRQAL